MKIISYQSFYLVVSALAKNVNYDSGGYSKIFPVIPNQEKQKMAKKKKLSKKNTALVAEKNEAAMVEGILEGSPDGIGVVIIRLECGCKKMAAVGHDGDAASEIIIYRDQAESICHKCKEDNGHYLRITEEFIHWQKPEPSDAQKEIINTKVFGPPPMTN